MLFCRKMMIMSSWPVRIIISLLFCCGVSVALDAQEEWRDSLYEDISVTTYDFSSDGEALQFDYYVATAANGPRPLLVYVHGGGFSGGRKDSKDIVQFAKQLAYRGYAVASVQYRLKMKGIGFGCDVAAETKVATFDAAAEDASRAVAAILADEETFDVDHSKVVLAGSSAGAEAVLHLAYVYDATELPGDFSFAGVIGMAGAVISVDKIDGKKAIPAQLFHGTGDQLVPYGIAPHHYCGGGDDGYLVLYGSEPIAQRLHGLGVSYYLYAEEGGSHVWAGRPMFRCQNEIVDFLYNDVVSPTHIRQTKRILVRK